MTAARQPALQRFDRPLGSGHRRTRSDPVLHHEQRAPGLILRSSASVAAGSGTVHR